MRTFKLEAERSEPAADGKALECHVAVSPYFFPEYLTCGYDSKHGCVAIDFAYIDNEPGESQLGEDDAVSFIVGIHTRRLLGVRFHVAQHDADKIKLFVHERAPEAIQRLRSQQEPAWTASMAPIRTNYEEAANAIREHSMDIMQSAAVPVASG